jgi:hypothetical protein
MTLLMLFFVYIPLILFYIIIGIISYDFIHRFWKN